MGDRSYGGRVQHEIDVEGAAMGDAMAEAALPGVFATGKTIANSSSGVDPATGKKFITFGFDDGSSLTFVGAYEVRATKAGTFSCDPDESGGVKDLVESGKQLMSGDQVEEGEWEDLP